MAGRAYYHVENRLLDAGNPDDREIVKSYIDAEQKPDRGTFTCEVSGTPMFATHRGETVYLSHFRNEGVCCKIR